METVVSDRRGRKYENDNATDGDFPGHYSVSGLSGVAWYVLGWEVEALAVIGCTGCDYHAIERDGGGGRVLMPHSPDCPEDAELFTGEEPDYERTGNVLATMVGDDGINSVDPDDLTMIPDDSYCGECGQIGCGCYVTA